MSPTERIAAILKVTVSDAQKFCLDVQKPFKPDSGKPSFKIIAKAVEENPTTDPKEIDYMISPDLIFGTKARLMALQKSHDQPQLPSKLTQTELIKVIANLIPDKDKGNEEAAKQLLIDLERIRPDIKRLQNEQIVSAVKRAARKGLLSIDQLEVEIRKEIYDYQGDPDGIQIIYTPMGGKPPR